MTEKDLLVEADRSFDKSLCMLGVNFKGNGYHSKVAPGTWVHPTRQTIYYALHLLNTKDKNDEKRAFSIIRKIISLQDTDSYSPTYGIWSWLYEEPLEMMSPPDWNWADFIGAALAHVIKDFGSRLPAELFQGVKDSLGHAAWSIFRRNVRPDYTNIALMGAAVTAVAGEILEEPRLVDYALLRIRSFEEYTLQQGGLNEYNSPTYTFVALHELERIISLVENCDIKKYAERIRYIVWKSIAEHYHPATGQLAGPHSRAYSDLLSPITLDYIKLTTSKNSISKYVSLLNFVEPILCPEEFWHRFKALPSQETVQKDVFVKRETPEKSFCGSTWMNNAVSLGTISRECFWTQRHPFIGYWNNGSGGVSVLKLRMLKDGKDFACGGLHNVQERNRVLTGIKFYIDRGDFHLHLDRSKDNVYSFKTLVLRMELTDENAVINELCNNKYELIAGKWKAVITTLPGKFNGHSIEWRIGRTDDKVYLDGILYDGEECIFKLDESVLTEIVIATELIELGLSGSGEVPSFQRQGTHMEAKWGNLNLSYNPYAELY